MRPALTQAVALAGVAAVWLVCLYVLAVWPWHTLTVISVGAVLTSLIHRGERFATVRETSTGGAR